MTLANYTGTQTAKTNIEVGSIRQKENIQYIEETLEEIIKKQYFIK